MARPTIATKLYAPKLRRGLVTRPRLNARLRDGANARLTLVSAPAGFGKTTLLAEWVEEATAEGRAIAWLSLDPSDNEPASFWTYVVSALSAAAEATGTSMLDLIASAPPLPAESLLAALVNTLSAFPEDLWLVLDDYHVIDNGDVRTGMASLLEHLPPSVHVLISTRADPDLPLARLRVSGELVEIRAADLRFDPGEAAAYLDGAGLRLTTEDVVVLQERTEGWIAALQLAALSLKGRDDVGEFVAQFTGNDRYVVDYLVEEVLRQLPEAVRDFLLQSAVLDRLTGPLCDAVTGRDDGGDTLLALERGNLFVIALDDRREWYRYHHLFADVLRARLLSEQPELMPLLHQRASRWCADHDLDTDAIRHSLAARDFGRAAYLMELAVPTIRRYRQDGVMFGWLRALPDDTIQRSPVLSVFAGWMSLVSGNLEGLEARLDDAERALGAVRAGSAPPWADTAELRTLPATIAVYRASLAQARGDAAGTSAHARRALELAGPNDHLARGGAAGFLGLAAWAAGDVPLALRTFTEAVASLHAAGHFVDELNGTVVLADLSLAVGRPSTAHLLAQRGLRRANEHGAMTTGAAAALHVALSELDYELGDVPSARGHVEAATSFYGRAPMTESHYRWFSAQARVAAAVGDPEDAADLLDQAEQRYRSGVFPDVRPIPAVRARMWITKGDLLQAADWARAAGVSVADDVSYRREFEHLTLVRLVIAQHRQHDATDELERALSLLDRMGDAAEASERAGSLFEIRALQALAHEAAGRRVQAREALGRALAEVPEPEGYARLLLDEGPPMALLLGDAQQQGVVREHAARLLVRLSASSDAGAEPMVEAPELPSGDPMTKRELQVLRLLDSELSGPQMARELFVSQNTLRTHTKHIFTKLDVTTRRAAVSRARERGLL